MEIAKRYLIVALLAGAGCLLEAPPDGSNGPAASAGVETVRSALDPVGCEHDLSRHMVIAPADRRMRDVRLYRDDLRLVRRSLLLLHPLGSGLRGRRDQHLPAAV